MNKKPIVVSAMAIAISGVVLWLWSPWHSGLVTINVRNMPVAQVVRAIQKQTQQPIKLDPKLDGLITLNMKNKPLSEVFDRLTQQVSASWSTIYAVYDSPQALHALETILPGQANLQSAGWKKIAPVELTHPGLSEEAGITGNESLPPGARRIIQTEDVVTTRHGTNSLKLVPRVGGEPRGPGIVVVRKRGDGTMEQEVWSPVELLLEERLASKLKGDFSETANFEEAQQAANEVNGRLTVFYALRKSSLGMGMDGMPPLQRRSTSQEPGLSVSGGNPAGKEVSSLRASMPVRDIEDAVLRQKLEELGRLTPEQRVMRSRERQQATHP